MLLLNYSNTETFLFTDNLYTYEKRITRFPCYELITLRKRKAEILISVDYNNKTVSINGKEFTTSLNSEFTYKKSKGNHIEVSNFNRFVEHLKESSHYKNVFHSTTGGFLLKLTKGKYTKVYN